jgi:hypothetical protein
VAEAKGRIAELLANRSKGPALASAIADRLDAADIDGAIALAQTTARRVGLWIALAIVGSLLFTGAIMALINYEVSATQEAARLATGASTSTASVRDEFDEMKNATDVFIGDVHAGRFAEAYAKTGAGYRASVTLPRFTAGVKASAYLRGARSFGALKSRVSQGAGQLDGTLQSDVGPVSGVVSFSFVDGTWWIVGVTLAGASALPGPA